MTDEHPVAVTGLQKKRAEIAGIINDLERQLVERRNDLIALDRALALMGSPVPGEAVPAKRVKPPAAGYLMPKEVSRRILEALRDNETVSAGELASTAMQDKGIDDPAVRAKLVRRFLVRLTQMKDAGRVERIGFGYRVRWRLADEA